MDDYMMLVAVPTDNDDIQKALESCLSNSKQLSMCKSVGGWIQSGLNVAFKGLNSVLVKFLSSKYDKSTIKKIGNTARDLIITVLTAIFSAVVGILMNPHWWKFALSTSGKAFSAEDSYMKGIMAFAKKFVTVIFATLEKIIAKVLKTKEMSLSQSEDAKLEELLNGAFGITGLDLNAINV
mmetsp:Transcript_54842/g.49357  ORF Transcript_54842/g.49357 Transcript_54842/m.49357 type:complete len:181 (-) Transcript_54842:240-782(-)